MTFKIHKAVIRPPFPDAVHRVFMPPNAKLDPNMVVAHPEGVAVFYGAHDAEKQMQVARYLMMFTTEQQVGAPILGDLNYITTLVGAHMEVGGKLLVAGQPPQPRIVAEEWHVFELIPANADDVEKFGKERPSGKAN